MFWAVMERFIEVLALVSIMLIFLAAGGLYLFSRWWNGR